MRSSSKKPRRYIGAYALTRVHDERAKLARVVVTVGAGDPEAGKVVALDECYASELADQIPQIEAGVRAREGVRDTEPLEVRWFTMVSGPGTEMETVEVPSDYLEASFEQKEVVCLSGLSWAEEEDLRRRNRSAAVQFDGRLCHVVTFDNEEIEKAVALAGGIDVAVAPEAIAFVEGWRAAHPEVFDRSEEGTYMALLCEQTTVSIAIVEAGEPLFARQVSLESELRDLVAAEAPVAGAAIAGDDDFAMPTSSEASWKRRKTTDLGTVDSHLWIQALATVTRRELDLSIEFGCYPGEIRRCYVAGEAAETHNLVAALADRFDHRFEVEELLMGNAVGKPREDTELMAALARGELSFAPAFALAAAARRPDLVTVSLEPEPAVGFVPAPAPARRRVALSGLGSNLTAGALLFLLVFAAAFGGRLYHVTGQLEAQKARLRQEQDRAQELAAVQAERARDQARMEYCSQMLGGIEAIRKRQQAPVELLERVVGLLPKGAGLEELALSGTSLVIRGQSENPDDAATFAVALQNSGGAFTQVIPSTDSGTIVKATAEETDTGEADVRPIIKFTINCKFNPAARSDAERNVVK